MFSRSATLFSSRTSWACAALVAVAACGGESSHRSSTEPAAGSGGSGAHPGDAGGTGGSGAKGGTGTKGGSGGSVITDGGSGVRGGSGGSGAGGGGTAGTLIGDGGTGFPRGGSAGSMPIGGFTNGGVSGTSSSTMYPCVPSSSGSGTLGECTNGFWHRPGPVMWILPPRRIADAGGAGGEAGNPLANTNNECWFDSDCAEHPNGYCVGLGKVGSYTFRCQYGCGSDADCATGETCSCDTQLTIEDSGVSERIPICLPSNCRLDMDCKPGFACLSTYQDACLSTGSSGFFCQSPADTCGPPNAGCGQNQQCAFVHDHFECTDLPLCGGF